MGKRRLRHPEELLEAKPLTPAKLPDQKWFVTLYRRNGERDHRRAKTYNQAKERVKDAFEWDLYEVYSHAWIGRVLWFGFLTLGWDLFDHTL